MTWNQTEINIQFAWGPAGLAHLNAPQRRHHYRGCLVVFDLRRCRCQPRLRCLSLDRARPISCCLCAVPGRPADRDETCRTTHLRSLPPPCSACPGEPRSFCPPRTAPPSAWRPATSRPSQAACGMPGPSPRPPSSSAAEISVIAAGEKWPDGSLRPALEDLLGAGAILSRLEGNLSGDAQAAVAAFEE